MTNSASKNNKNYLKEDYSEDERTEEFRNTIEIERFICTSNTTSTKATIKSSPTKITEFEADASLKDKLAYFKQMAEHEKLRRKEEVEGFKYIEREKLRPVEMQILELMKKQEELERQRLEEEKYFEYVDEQEELERQRLEEERKLNEELERQRLEEEQRLQEELERQRLEEELKNQCIKNGNIELNDEKDDIIGSESNTTQGYDDFIAFNLKKYDCLLVTDMCSSVKGNRFIKTNKIRSQSSTLRRLFSICCGKEAFEDIDIEIAIVQTKKNMLEEIEIKTSNIKVTVSI